MAQKNQSARVKGTRIDLIVAIIIGALLCVGLYMAFYYAPVANNNGLLWWSQKIFYIHVPSAWGSMIGLVLVLVGSIAYLQSKNEKWDSFAAALAEPSLIYATLVIITGPIWAKPSWNTYWQWEDPRLMSFFVWWLILVAYHLLRAFSEEGESKRVTSASLGILGAISVPFVFLSVRFGRTLHPKSVKTDPKIHITLLVFLAAFSLLFYLFYRLRRRMEDQNKQLYRLTQLLDDE